MIGREGRLRVDAVPKILGTTHFTIDQSLPGMLTAIVLHPPRFGATAAAVDDQAALAEAGVTAVVPTAEGVGVVAETFADAQRGLRALAVEWDDTNAERRSTPELLAEHVRLLESGENAVTARDDGDVDRALAGAASTVDATYVLPYLAHGPMEPNNAACRMREDGVLEVWVGTEAPEYVKMNASSIAGMDKEQVEVHVTFAGGSFGLHSSAERDPTAEAVQIARALDWKHPIKVQSLREEEFKVGRYRAMAVHRVRAGADADGRLTAWHQQIVAEPTSVNLPFVRDVMFTNGVDFFTTTGAVDPPYAVENFRLESTNFESRIPTMVWRSVGNSHTEFARESAIDELAIAAGRILSTPSTLRRDAAALDAADGRVRGRVLPQRQRDEMLDGRGRVHVDRIVFALDWGRRQPRPHPRAGEERAVGAQRRRGARSPRRGGDIVAQNFDATRSVRRSIPLIECTYRSTEPPTGVGEVSVPRSLPHWRTRSRL